MFKSILLNILFIAISMGVYAQKSVNSYKYIIVAKQYEFQKNPDSYQVNSLTKFLFERAGFTAFFNDETFPEELATNGCLGLKAIVVNNPSFLSVKMNINLLDCQNNIVFSTEVARSKEKDYKVAYHEAIRKTFVDIENLNYSYSREESQLAPPKEKEIAKIDEVVNDVPVTVDDKKAIAKEEVAVKKKKEIASQSKEKITVPVIKLQKATKVEKKPKVSKKIAERKNAEKKKEATKKDLVLKKAVQVFNLEGNYEVDGLGSCRIVKSGDQFNLLGGTEEFSFASISKTSKTNLYIIKWVAYKTPQLVTFDKDGNLLVDSEEGVKTYLRIN